jgi:transcriptional regulator with XRE-family HTH domain
MRIEEAVGHRLRQAREDHGLTQAELGEKLKLYLGKAWSRQAVSLAEAGQRSFTAAELVALARLLELPSPGSLLVPPLGVEEIEIGDGVRFNNWRDRSRLVEQETPAVQMSLAQVTDNLAVVEERLKALSDFVGQLQEGARQVEEHGSGGGRAS